MNKNMSWAATLRTKLALGKNHESGASGPALSPERRERVISSSTASGSLRVKGEDALLANMSNYAIAQVRMQAPCMAIIIKRGVSRELSIVKMP